MSTKNRRFGSLLRTFSFGLAVWACSSGLAAAQRPELLPARPNLAEPSAVLMPAVPSMWAVSGCAAGCDPISRVPNFFGDFVARPSGAIVVQPITVAPGSEGTVSTQTLNFRGNSTAFYGIFGPVTFFAPFSTIGSNGQGIAGPGGPYPITSDVTGFGIRPYSTAVLDQNAQLTARIRQNFPGATFVGGTGRDGVVTFDYLLTANGLPPTPPQVVPGLVALVNLPNPTGGGLVGRNKYFDDGSPQPRDRVFFDYNHVGSFQILDSQLDINRFVVGVEKTFLNGWGSIQVTVPFAGTMNSDQNGAALDVNHTEFGNVGLLLKGTLFRSANWLVSAGMGVSMPTADDSRLLFGGRSVIEIRNNAWLLQPIFGAIWAPNDRFYVQGGVQLDFDPTGNPVYVRSPGGEFSQRGVLRDQTYLYASGAAGYWVYQSDSSFLSGVSLQGELHYTRTISDRNFIQTGSVLVADLYDNLDVVNATTGVNLAFRDRANLAVGVSFPIAGERIYDWNLMARLNVRFGRVAR